MNSQIKMKIQEKIADIYQIYLLCDRNASQTLKYTKITRPTLHKYIRIQECLDHSLLEYLDKKGKEKLKIGDAINLCDSVFNPEQQYQIFQSYIKSPQSDRIRILNEKTTCSICCDVNQNFEFTPCCKTPICNTCFSKTFESCIQDIIFKPIQCPFCNVEFNLRYVRWFLMGLTKDKNVFWRNTKGYLKSLELSSIYSKNLYNKYNHLIGLIETKQNYYINDEEPNFKDLLGEELYFGACTECTPRVTNNALISRREWRRVMLCDIPKQCGNGEGGILVLQPEMFRCVVCKSRDEDYENGEFKKCPHCGIKTIKPDGCNYIYCRDHRWCFICNERLEDNNNGHNHHYYTGAGSGPYSNQCRQSIQSESPKFLIQGKCDCSACKEYGGRPLCRTLECMNRTDAIDPNEKENPMFHTYCSECRN